MTFWRVVGEMNEARRKEKRMAKILENDDKKTDEMDRKECRKMMKTNKGRRWKMKKNVGWGVCMKQFICGAWPPTTNIGDLLEVPGLMAVLLLGEGNPERFRRF